MSKQQEKSDFWTIFVSFSVAAGDMSKEEIIAQAQEDLNNLTDGTDYMSPLVSDAIRDDI